MATYFTYKCNDCGYEVTTNEAGFGGLMSGLVVDFRCNNCKEIVSVLMRGGMFWVDCPNCNERVTRTWNPIDGKCPKCDGEMKRVPGSCILAD